MYATLPGLLVAALLWHLPHGVADRALVEGRMSQDEAKAMILHFLDHSKLAQRTDWVSASRNEVEGRPARTFPANGFHRWGPWLVMPDEREVKLFSSRGILYGEIERTPDGYRIVHEEIARFIRRRPAN